MSKIIKSRKKLFFLGKRSYDNLGLYDLNYIKLLRKNNINLDISYLYSELYNLPFLKSVNYHEIFYYNKKKGISKIISYINSLYKIYKLIRKMNPDYIHMQWFLSPLLDYLWIRALKLFGYKGQFIKTVHNARSRYNRASTYLSYLCLKEMDKIIVHSVMCKKYLISTFPKLKRKSIFIGRYGCVNTSKNSFLSHEEDEILKSIIERTKTYQKTYIFTGNISPYKGFDTVIKAWEIYKENVKNNNLSCLIVIGRFEKELLYLKKKAIEFGSSILVIDRYLSDNLLNLSIKLSDFILLTHKYISHSGLYSDFIRYKKKYIYSNTKYNHMLSHDVFKKTGIPFNGTHKDLAKVFLSLDMQDPYLVKQTANDHDWEDAINYFSWKNCFPKELVNKIYQDK